MPLALTTKQWSLKPLITQCYVDNEINILLSPRCIFLNKEIQYDASLSCQTLKLRTNLKFHVLSFSKHLMC